MLASMCGISGWTKHESGIFSIDAVYRSLDRSVARRVSGGEGITAVYAYEDGASQTFAAAKALGLKCLYDLPIGYWRAAHPIYAEEMEREPQWASTLTGTLDSPEKLARKDEELRLADAVFVASSFTKKTIESAPENICKPVHVISYGSPFTPPPAIERGGNKLKILFVGGLGQRKGLAYLLKAVALLGERVELTLVGNKTTNHCAPLNEALQRHRWIPSLPHGEVLREMNRHDVFVFPSLFEGFGLVILEAMSQGLPVITTENTAGPDLITEGESGFIVPIRSAEAIAEKLDLLARDSSLLSAMKTAARETALRHTWEQYRTRLAQAVLAEMQENAEPR